MSYVRTGVRKKYYLESKLLFDQNIVIVDLFSPVLLLVVHTFLAKKLTKKTWRYSCSAKDIQYSMCRQNIVTHTHTKKVFKKKLKCFMSWPIILLSWLCISLGAQNQSQAWVQSLKVSWGDMHYKSITLKQPFGYGALHIMLMLIYKNRIENLKKIAWLEAK